MPTTTKKPSGRLHIDRDGRLTITLTHAQLMALETLALWPEWPDAARDAAEVLRELDL